MPDLSPPAPTGRRAARAARGRRKAPQPGRVVLGVVAASLLALGLATGVLVVVVYDNWNDNIDHSDVSDQLVDRPEKQAGTGDLNILVMGSDSRSCRGCGVDGESSAGLSDTTILFHVSGDRRFAYGISIPRDTAVRRPACTRADGSVVPASDGYVKWNEAFSAGGPGCTMQQFEQLTGVRLDHYVVVDFGQFKDMVDALDGVEVCLPVDVHDDAHDIHLEAGTREMGGDEALAYVRVRYGIGGGIDPNRTRRQQAFIAAMLDKALTAGMLARPDRLVGFMNAATDGLETDFENLAQMADLASTANGIGSENIKFVTTPWTFTEKVSAGVEWTPEVKRLWRLVIRDRPLTPEFLHQALTVGEGPDGSATTPDSDRPSGATPGTAGPSDPSDTGTPQGPQDDRSVEPPTGLDAEGREDAGLCS